MSLMPFISHVILFKQTQTMMYMDTKFTYFSRLPWGKWEELGFSPKTVQNRSIVQAYTGLQSCLAMLLSSPLVWVQLSLLQMVWLTPMDTFWSELPLRPALEQGRRVSLSCAAPSPAWMTLGAGTVSVWAEPSVLSPHLSPTDGKLNWVMWRFITSWKKHWWRFFELFRRVLQKLFLSSSQ